MSRFAIAVLRLAQAAFAVCTVAAIVDNVMPVAFVTGVLFAFVGAFIRWSKWDEENRKWDSEYPQAPTSDDIETIPEIPAEKSGPRTIDRRRHSKQRDLGAA